jgi:hypothetical protein
LTWEVFRVSLLKVQKAARPSTPATIVLVRQPAVTFTPAETTPGVSATAGQDSTVIA